MLWIEQKCALVREAVRARLTVVVDTDFPVAHALRENIARAKAVNVEEDDEGEFGDADGGGAAGGGGGPRGAGRGAPGAAAGGVLETLVRRPPRRPTTLPLLPSAGEAGVSGAFGIRTSGARARTSLLTCPVLGPSLSRACGALFWSPGADVDRGPHAVAKDICALAVAAKLREIAVVSPYHARRPHPTQSEKLRDVGGLSSSTLASWGVVTAQPWPAATKVWHHLVHR